MPPSDLLKRELAAPLWYAFSQGVGGRCPIDIDVFEHGWDRYNVSVGNNWANFPDAYPQAGVPDQDNRHKVPDSGSMSCAARAGRKAARIVKEVPTADRITITIFKQACLEVEEIITRAAIPGFVCG